MKKQMIQRSDVVGQALRVLSRLKLRKGSVITYVGIKKDGRVIIPSSWEAKVGLRAVVQEDTPMDAKYIKAIFEDDDCVTVPELEAVSFYEKDVI